MTARADVCERYPVDLPGRGRTLVWDWSGPAGAPVLLLLHGVTLDAEVNWCSAVPELRRHFRVIAFDLRGHGDGLPARAPYRLEDCADDAAALVRMLGLRQVVVGGYSMGGMVAQVFWRRHPGLTAGLVLCATGRSVHGSPLEQSVALMMPFVVSVAGWIRPLLPVGADVVGMQLLGDTLGARARRTALAHMRRTPLSTALAAMDAVCEFSSHRWIGGVDVPTAVLVTRQDRVVPPSRQRRLARAVPGASVVEIDGDHGVFLDAPGRFAAALTRACLAVAAPVARPVGGGPARRAS
jgi:3-oxoadipate enol-lactonase